MKILVINSWSSSLKYQVFDMNNSTILIKWIISKIWEKNSSFKNHEIAIKSVFNLLLDKKTKILNSINELGAIGHRVVHGWEYFQDSIIINDNVISKIKKCNLLAPLHNPNNLLWINACKSLFPKIKQVAVFDTAFHQTMKPENYLYAIPYKYYEKYKIRRYWFHGTSNKYVYQKLLTDYKLKSKHKVITCHIGNGASITAIDSWRVVETSMWLTPLEWLIMWTRCWNIDPTIITYLLKEEKLSIEDIYDILNKKSWLLWLTGISNDMRDVIQLSKDWNKRCDIAINMYLNSMIKYIGWYIWLLWWLDVLLLTWWMMEWSMIIRKKLMERLICFWVKFNSKANNFDTKEATISSKDSKIKVIVIPTNEEFMIAEETAKLIAKSKKTKIVK
jgi:acetate kinase